MKTSSLNDNNYTNEQLYEIKDNLNEVVECYKALLNVLKNNISIDGDVIYKNEFNTNLEELEKMIYKVDDILNIKNDGE